MTKHRLCQQADAPGKDKQTPAYLTLGQLERLLEYTHWHEENVEDAVGRSPELGWLRDAVRIALATGLRRGELANLRWDDVDLEEGQIHVRNRREEGHRTKTGAERVVPVRGPALDVLRGRHANREEFAGPVITDSEGNSIKPDRMT